MLYAARGAPIILLTANHILSPRVGFPRTKNVGGAYKQVAGCFDGKVDKFGAFQISFTVRVQSDRFITTPFTPAGVPSENVPSEHEADVGAVGGIGEDHLPQVVGRDPQPDGDGKEIDDLGGVGPKEMRPQDAAGALLNQDLEA